MSAPVTTMMTTVPRSRARAVTRDYGVDQVKSDETAVSGDNPSVKMTTADIDPAVQLSLGGEENEFGLEEGEQMAGQRTSPQPGAEPQETSPQPGQAALEAQNQRVQAARTPEEVDQEYNKMMALSKERPGVPSPQEPSEFPEIPDRRVQDIARQDIDRRQKTATQPSRGFGTGGNDFPPLTREELASETGKAGLPPRKAGEVGEVGQPLPEDYPTLPEEKQAATERPAAEAPATGEGAPETGDISEGIEPHVLKAAHDLLLRGHGEEASMLLGMPPEARAERAKALNRVMSGTHNPENRPKAASGVQARTAGQAKLIDDIAQANKRAVEQHPPEPNESIGMTVDRAKNIHDDAHANMNNGSGKHPLDLYKPRQKDAAYQIVAAARRLIRKPTNAAVQKFRTDEALLRGGGAEEVQAERRAESDISMNKRGAGEAPEMAAKTITETPPEERVKFPDVPPEKLAEGRAIDEDRQSLNEYLNGLSDKDYNRLVAEHGDPDLPFSEQATRTSHPYDFQQLMEKTLAEPVTAPVTSRLIKAAPKEAVSEAAPAAPPVKVKGAEVAAPITKVPVEKINEANARLGKKVSKEEIAAFKAQKAKVAALKAAEDAARQAKDTEVENDAADKWLKANDKALPPEVQEAKAKDHAAAGVPKDAPNPLLRKAAGFMKDEKGAVNLPSWLYDRVADIFHPRALSDVQEKVGQMHDWFVRYTNDAKNLTAKHMRYLAERPDISYKEATNVRNALETRDYSKLTQKESDAIPFFQKLRGDYNDALENAMGEHPERFKGKIYYGYSKDFVPRNRIGDVPKEQNYDVTNTGKTLSSWRPATQARDFVGFEDANGNRGVGKFDNNGDLVVWKNGSPRPVKLALGDQTNPGDKFTMPFGPKNKKVPTEFTIDHGTVDEIEAAVNGKKKPGDPDTVFYNRDPTFDYMKAIQELEGMRSADRVLEKLKSDPIRKNYSIVRKPNAEGKMPEIPKGWRTTSLPEMATTSDLNQHDIYYHPNIANKLDDFNKMGLGNREEWLDRVRQGVRGVSNALYFFGPFIHAANEGVQWATAKGSDWIKPTEFGHLFTEGRNAMKSVNTQDHYQDEMRRAGANPMLMSTILDHGFMEHLAQSLGVELHKDPSIWDPVTKATGVNVPEFGRALLKKSNYGMWWANDVMLTNLVMRNMRQGTARDPNYTMKQAVDQAHQFVSDYQERKGTILGSRGLQQAAMEPALSWFGRYHVGIFRSMGHMFNQVLKGTGQGRAEGLAQFAILAGLTYGVLPSLNWLGQKVTGNKNFEFSPRGMGTLVKAAETMLTKGPSEYPKAVRQAWTPSPAVQAATEVPFNYDTFTGKPLVPPGSSWKRGAAKLGDYAISKVVPPYGQMSRETAKNRRRIGRQGLRRGVNRSPREVAGSR